MTKIEFENRAMEVSNKEFEAINEVYMNCDLDKDEFCKMWCKMNAKRVKAYKDAKKAEEERDEMMWKLAEIANRDYTDSEYAEFAENVLSEADMKVIEKAGIDDMVYDYMSYIDETGTIHYIAGFKRLFTIIAEVKDLIAA